MAIAYDSGNTALAFGANTVTTASFTIAATANRVAILALGFYADLRARGFSTITCAGQSGSAVSSAEAWNSGGTTGLKMFAVTNPDSGSAKTATIAFDGGTATVCLTATVFNGVDQTTPTNGGGGTTTTYGTTCALQVTSPSGDMSVTSVNTNVADNAATSSETRTIQAAVSQDAKTTSTTVNPTHTWSHSATTLAVAGVNLVQYVAASGFVPYPFSRGARGGLLVLSGGLS
jgi:hypothetical protein